MFSSVPGFWTGKDPVSKIPRGPKVTFCPGPQDSLLHLPINTNRLFACTANHVAPQPWIGESCGSTALDWRIMWPHSLGLVNHVASQPRIGESCGPTA